MSDIVKCQNKRKRIKVECLTCGSIFDDDYRKKHEINIHHGKRIKVKHLGAPASPFEFARKNFEKVSTYLNCKLLLNL